MELKIPPITNAAAPKLMLILTTTPELIILIDLFSEDEEWGLIVITMLPTIAKRIIKAARINQIKYIVYITFPILAI